MADPSLDPGIITDDPVDRQAIKLLLAPYRDAPDIEGYSVAELDTFWRRMAARLGQEDVAEIDRRLAELLAQANGPDGAPYARAHELLEIVEFHMNETIRLRDHV